MWKWLLSIGVVLGLITAFLLKTHIDKIESGQSSIQLLKLKEGVSLSAGDVISDASVLAYINFPEKFSSMKDIVIAGNQDSVDWIFGRRVNQDVSAGELLQYKFFSDSPETRFSEQIDKDKRALTIAVNQTSSVANFVAPGSRVDVIGTMTFEDKTGADKEALEVTQTLLQNIRVIAVGRNTSRQNYINNQASGYGTVTLEVTPIQAEILVFAMDKGAGQLTLLLRNPSNNKKINIPGVSWEQLKKSDP